MSLVFLSPSVKERCGSYLFIYLFIPYSWEEFFWMYLSLVGWHSFVCTEREQNRSCHGVMIWFVFFFISWIASKLSVCYYVQGRVCFLKYVSSNFYLFVFFYLLFYWFFILIFIGFWLSLFYLIEGFGSVFYFICILFDLIYVRMLRKSLD